MQHLARPGEHRAAVEVALAVHRHEDHATLRRVLRQHLRGLYTVHARQRGIDHGHVGLQAQRLLDGALAVGGAAEDDDRLLAGEAAREVGDDALAAVGEQDPDHACLRPRLNRRRLPRPRARLSSET